MIGRGLGIGFLVMTAGFVLAGEDSPHEQSIKQMLKGFDEISTVLKKIESEETAVAAKPDLRKLSDTWIEQRGKAAKLPPPEREEKARLTKLYKPKLDQAMRKLFTEVVRVEAIPGGKDAVKEISGVLKKDEKR
jgi:hypothetical protein